jgi:copper(I)-binding protein
MNPMTDFKKSLIALSCLCPLICYAEPVQISHAWARATAPGQEVGAAYMALKSDTDTTLTEITSPAADSIEIHKMQMDKGVMQMQMLEKLALPAGKTVKLEPGGFHLMLFDLKAPLQAGKRMTLKLQFRDKSGKSHTQEVTAPIKAVDD